MKLFLFKILLLHRTKDQGFTLPMVIGIGLIMVLLSSISLLQASEENLIAISKTQSSTSLAMAELGISRYRELLNNNRVLAVNSLANWTAVNNETCDPILAEAGGWAYNGWINSTDPNIDPGWRPVTFDETALATPMDLNNDGDATDTDAEIGSYRIVNYVYQNDNDFTDDGIMYPSDIIEPGDAIDPGEDGIFDQTADAANPNSPRGILRVQGRAAGSDSIAQIQVRIPIGVNTDDLETLDPGIWIHQSSVENLGTINRVDSSLSNNGLGNLVLYRDTTGDPCVADGADPEDMRDPRDLPPLATLPAIVNNMNGDISADGDFDKDNDNDDDLILGTFSANPNLDADGVERYYYQLTTGTDLTVGNNERLLADGNARVVIIVNGNLNITGTGGVVFVGNTSDNPLVTTPFYAKSNYLEIHVNGDVNFSGSGRLFVNGLIRATGTVNITGSPTINLHGSIWAEDWSNNGGTVNIIRDVGYDDYKSYSIISNRTPKPLTFAPTGWEQQEATN